jgi:hypothetical protein
VDFAGFAAAHDRELAFEDGRPDRPLAQRLGALEVGLQLRRQAGAAMKVALQVGVLARLGRGQRRGVDQLALGYSLLPLAPERLGKATSTGDLGRLSDSQGSRRMIRTSSARCGAGWSMSISSAKLPTWGKGAGVESMMRLLCCRPQDIREISRVKSWCGDCPADGAERHIAHRGALEFTVR